MCLCLLIIIVNDRVREHVMSIGLEILLERRLIGRRGWKKPENDYPFSMGKEQKHSKSTLRQEFL